jgi:hypothetical protein
MPLSTAPKTYWPIQGKDANFSNIELSGALKTPGIQNTATLAAADGAIAVKLGVVAITKGTAAVLTLASPTAGTDDGKLLTIVSTTAAAHTVTVTAGFNGSGTAGDVATFGAAAGNSISVVAYNGVWYVTNLQGVTLG